MSLPYKKPKNIQDLKDLYASVFIMRPEDLIIIEVMVAIALAVKLEGDPIWLMIIGGSSSGKSEIINTLNKVQWNTPVSSLTENSFLSSMKGKDGAETSLLKRMGTKGMLTFKDYTSILSMRPEKRDLIVSQMREIFDGKLEKKSGNGNNPSWEGKMNCILAVTPSIFTKEGESAGMGRRTLNYIMPELDNDREMCLRSMENTIDIQEKREMLQNAFAEYIDEQSKILPEVLPEVDIELSHELIDLAIFMTQARTPVEREYNGDLKLVHSKEKPTRAFGQLQGLARVLAWVSGGQNILSKDHLTILYKIAIDGIPQQRMDALKIMAKYNRIRCSAAAKEINRPSDWLKRHAEELNWLEICDRKTEGSADVFVLKKKYRDIMKKYVHIEALDMELTDDSVTPSGISLSDLQRFGSASSEWFPENDPDIDPDRKREIEEANERQKEQDLIEEERKRQSKVRQEREDQEAERLRLAKIKEDEDLLEASKMQF